MRIGGTCDSSTVHDCVMALDNDHLVGQNVMVIYLINRLNFATYLKLGSCGTIFFCVDSTHFYFFQCSATIKTLN